MTRPADNPIPARDLRALFAPRSPVPHHDEEPFGDVTLGEAIGMLLAAWIAAALFGLTRPRALVLIALAVAAYCGGKLSGVML